MTQAKKPDLEQRKRKVLPPVYLLLAFALMELLHHVAPLGRFIEAPYSYLGAVSLLAGLLMSATAARSFRKAGTPVVPFEPSTALVTSGFTVFVPTGAWERRDWDGDGEVYAA